MDTCQACCFVFVKELKREDMSTAYAIFPFEKELYFIKEWFFVNEASFDKNE